MPPKKGANVSSSSFFDLRAEIVKHEEEFAKNKGKAKVIVGGVKRPDKVCSLVAFIPDLTYQPPDDYALDESRNLAYGRNKTREFVIAQLVMSSWKKSVNRHWILRGLSWRRNPRCMIS